MSDFEYTVTEPFTMRMDDQGSIRVFGVGEHVKDESLFARIEESFHRQVVRHYPRPAPKVSTEPPKAVAQPVAATKPPASA